MTKETNNSEAQVAVYHTSKDLMSAVFIVSVLLNLAIFITWLLILTDPHLSFYLVTHS